MLPRQINSQHRKVKLTRPNQQVREVNKAVNILSVSSNKTKYNKQYAHKKAKFPLIEILGAIQLKLESASAPLINLINLESNTTRVQGIEFNIQLSRNSA
jgi:hypothetical protein